MSDLPDGITQDDLDKYAKIDAAMKKLEPEKKRIADLIKKAFDKPGTFVHGNVVIERTTAKLRATKDFLSDYPADEYPEFYVNEPKINWDAVSEEDAAEYWTASEKLSVKVVSE